jgi:hypothetical protein
VEFFSNSLTFCQEFLSGHHAVALLCQKVFRPGSHPDGHPRLI